MINPAFFLRNKVENPTDKLAELVTERFSKADTLATDIDGIAQKLAEVYYDSWEYDIDGLASNLQDDRPKIFIRILDSRWGRRQRFTLAHEVGHVAIPWHIGQQTCSISSSSYGVGQNLEAEANRFASQVLMPRKVLARLLHESNSLQQFFETVDGFELSPDATVIALCQSLIPGFVFRYAPYGSVIKRFSDTNPSIPGQFIGREEQLVALALESGRFTVDGREICWYFLGDKRFQWSATYDGRRSIDILRAVLPTSGMGDRQSSVNSIVSGLLGTLKTYSPELLYNHVNLRLRFHEGITEDLQQDVGFQLYLRKFIEERLSKEQAKHKKQNG